MKKHATWISLCLFLAAPAVHAESPVEDTPPAVVSTDDNKAATRRIYDAFNSKDLTKLDDLIAWDAYDHDIPAGELNGLPGVKQFMTLFASAFPDYDFMVDDMIAEGDKVAVRFTVRGTHRGAFLGVPPSGKSVSFSGLEILRFSNGKAVEHWGQSDVVGLMEQIKPEETSGIETPPASEAPVDQSSTTIPQEP